MKKVLGLTVVLALCLSTAALACEGAKGASAGACMKGAKATSAMACPGMKGTEASAASACMKGAKATSAMACPGMKNASAGKCNMDAAACAKMEHSSFTVAGLKAKGAVAKVQAALADMDNVQMVKCDARKGTAMVCWKGEKDVEAVAKKLTEAGYKTAVLKADAACPAGSACCKKGDKPVDPS
jgi:hypothetical protein